VLALELIHKDAEIMNVAVVGAGIGGLTCAIACRRANIDVTVVEKTPELLAIGAGIHIPPNSSRILTKLGLYEDLLKHKAYEVEEFTLRRYETGKILANKPLSARCKREYGSEWL
jgi:salicylate hydroxylase